MTISVDPSLANWMSFKAANASGKGCVVHIYIVFHDTKLCYDQIYAATLMDESMQPLTTNDDIRNTREFRWNNNINVAQATHNNYYPLIRPDEPCGVSSEIKGWSMRLHYYHYISWQQLLHMLNDAMIRLMESVKLMWLRYYQCVIHVLQHKPDSNAPIKNKMYNRTSN